MSRIFFTLTVLLSYISCSAQNTTVSSGVVRKLAGEMVTIQCRYPQKDQDNLTLKGGLNKNVDVVFRDSNSSKTMIVDGFKDRLQINGEFPDFDILIKNLTPEDTGPYWCEYKKFDIQTGKNKGQKGTGSVLLVVTAPHVTDESKSCDPTNKNLVLVPVVISAVVLICIIMFVLIWILKNKPLHTRSKPKHPVTNDVYEDMRGQLRR